MNAVSYEIQDLVQASGVPRRNIYFYVQQGLLPPPAGAGLAARYNHEHLLRLRLIPLLRGQGLRLDQIRARFAALTIAEMEKMLALDPHLQPGAPISPVEKPAVSPLPAGQACARYDLPGGIVLIVPTGLRPEHRQLADRLIRLAEPDPTAPEAI